MMLIDLERRWAKDGACRKEDPELFFTAGGMLSKKPTKSMRADWAKAKQICKKCPVLNQCRRDTLGEERGVWGGLDEYERYLIRRALPKAAKNWPQSRRLAFGQMLYDLRYKPGLNGGRSIRLGWSTIREMTGIPPELAEELVNEYDAHKKATEAKTKRKTKVIDLPLDRAPVPFPKVPGSKHMWVRHNGIVSDGAYRGESLDGRHVLAEVKAGRGRVQKWVRIEDVKFHRPIPRYVVPKKERAA